MRKLFLTIVLLLSAALFGCSHSDKNEGEATAYAPNSDGTGLVSRAVSFDAYDTEGRIEEMIKALQSAEKGKYKAVLPEDSVLSLSYADGELRLKNYAQLEVDDFGLSKVLNRAALVKSFCSIDYIEKVVIELGEADGSELTLTADSFLESFSTEPVRQKMVLYFGAPERDGLIESSDFFETDGSKPAVYWIVERLIEGPGELPGIAIIPPGTKIRSVTLSGGHCVVDLSEEFQNYLNAVPAALTVYSIVNSLTSLSTVNDVEILVEGRREYSYLGFNMNQVFGYYEKLVH